MTTHKSYAALTRHDPNPLKRWLQNRRFDDAIALLNGCKPVTVVDYGTGDGELAIRLKAQFSSTQVVCFEPSPPLYAQAEAHLSGYDDIRLTSEARGIDDGWADAVFCLEVFEHLPPEQTVEALRQIHRILKPEGLLIVGVPVEIGVVALFKGWFRRRRRQKDFDGDWQRIAQAARKDIRFERHKVEFAQGFSYYPHHLGFDFRHLLAAVAPWFHIDHKRASPFAILPTDVNSELNLRLVRRCQ